MSQANHNSEYRQIKRKSGKWSKPGVPHKGWTCTGFEDLGGSNEVCGMCEFQLIRYIHYMKHPEYPEVIAAGCVCAGQMEQDTGRPVIEKKACAIRRDAAVNGRSENGKSHRMAMSILIRVTGITSWFILQGTISGVELSRAQMIIAKFACYGAIRHRTR